MKAATLTLTSVQSDNGWSLSTKINPECKEFIYNGFGLSNLATEQFLQYLHDKAPGKIVEVTVSLSEIPKFFYDD